MFPPDCVTEFHSIFVQLTIFDEVAAYLTDRRFLARFCDLFECISAFN